MEKLKDSSNESTKRADISRLLGDIWGNWKDVVGDCMYHPRAPADEGTWS